MHAAAAAAAAFCAGCAGWFAGLAHWRSATLRFLTPAARLRRARSRRITTRFILLFRVTAITAQRAHCAAAAACARLLFALRFLSLATHKPSIHHRSWLSAFYWLSALLSCAASSAFCYLAASNLYRLFAVVALLWLYLGVALNRGGAYWRNIDAAAYYHHLVRATDLLTLLTYSSSLPLPCRVTAAQYNAARA